jgi:hypothetical protein
MVITERHMSGQQADLVEELKRLRRGRGVHASNLTELVGPGLRRLCAVVEGDDSVTVRHKVTVKLSELATTFPEDLRLALLAELALHPDAGQRLLTQRMEWLSTQLTRDLRTARRRADEACLRLAEAAEALVTENGGGSDDGWYIRSFNAVVRMDTPTPEVIERRTIVATRDGLDQIVRWMSVVRHPGDQGTAHGLSASILYGGRLVQREQPSESHFRFVVALPTALRTGQTHELGMMFRLPPGQRMRTHYVCTPLRRCDHFELRIRFDLARVPRTIWRLTAAPIRVVDDAEPCGELLSVDSAGEIRADFRDLAQGLCYGIQWRA